mgnify:FL=1
MHHFKLRYYQLDISNKAVDILTKYGIVYLAMEVRTGKTLTALNIVENLGLKNCLFLTKKKAISSIEHDFKMSGYNYNLTVINDESMHLISEKFDIIIHDEHHRFGAMPKPNKYAIEFKKRFGNLPMIFLSGTPTPENYSQIFHQFWVSNYSPFNQYSNFYKWAKDFVNVTQRNFGYAISNDYTSAKIDLIKPIIDKYMIYFTQNQAGFNSEIKETICKVAMMQETKMIIKKLIKDEVLLFGDEVILADTSLKLMQKLHQLWSGTCLFESKKSHILDYSKAEFIAEKFKDYKIGIFYKFKAEYELLENHFGSKITNDIDEFNNTDKWIALQIISGREGISLKNADYLVYYNIDFLATSYWQSRDRMTTMDRKFNEVFWIFAEGGIEEKIYKLVMSKKTFTKSHFKDYVRATNTEKDNRLLSQFRLFDNQDNQDKHERLPGSFNTEGW